jgi:transposase InsO family protein
MITEKAKQKVRILAFWEAYGLQATKDAFKVSKPTLYRWATSFEKGGKKIEALNDQSKAPKRRRKRVVDARIKEFIISQRKLHPRLGKEKLAALLKSQCLLWTIPSPSDSTVGRIIHDLKKKGEIPSFHAMSYWAKSDSFREKHRFKRKKLRRKGYQPSQGGDLVQVDTIVKFINGARRYIVTAIDVKTDFAFAYAYQSLSSATAADFFEKLERVTPFAISHVQTDNGLEFEKHFREYATKRNIIHFHNYPKSPKMNCYVERFNRTVKEEFANQHWLTLRDDIAHFNRQLMDWLLWYNTARPHWSLKMQSPMQVIIKGLIPEKSHMWWTDTNF